MLLIDIFGKNERSLEEIIQAYENAKSWLESKGTVNLIFFRRILFSVQFEALCYFQILYAGNLCPLIKSLLSK